MAKFIQKMTKQGYGIDNWHLIGHSLGAQLAGFVGKRIQYLSNHSLKLPRCVVDLRDAHLDFKFHFFLE